MENKLLFLFAVIAFNFLNNYKVESTNVTDTASCQALTLISVSYVFEGFNTAVDHRRDVKKQSEIVDNDNHFVTNPHMYDMLPFNQFENQTNFNDISYISSAPVYDWNYARYTKYSVLYNNTEQAEPQLHDRDNDDNYNITGDYNLLITGSINQNLQLCFTSDLNGYDTVQTYGKGFVTMSNPTQLNLKINSIRTYLSVSTYQKCIANIQISANCNCDCPLGSNTCDSTTNQCSIDNIPDNVCDSTYESGVYSSGSNCDKAQRSELCCEYHLSNWNDATMYYIGSNVKRMANVTLTTNSLIKPDYNTSDTFLVDLDSPNYHLGSNILLVFQGSFYGNTYKGNEYIMQEIDGLTINTPGTPQYYVVEGYNSANSYDTDLGCWIKKNSQNGIVTADGNFANTYRVNVDSCGDNEFTFTKQSFNPTNISSGNELLSEHLSPFGNLKILFNNNFSEKDIASNLTTIYIEEINSPAITVSVTVKAKNAVFNVRITGVYNLTCSATQLYSQGGALNCSAVFEDIGFSKLTIYNSEGQDLSETTLESTQVNQTVNAIISLLAISKATDETYSGCMYSSLTINNNSMICVNFTVKQNIIVIADPHGPTIVQSGGSHGDDNGNDLNGIAQDFKDFANWFTSGFWTWSNWRNWIVALVIIVVVVVVIIIALVVTFYCLRIKFFLNSGKKYKHLYSDEVEMRNELMHEDIEH